MDIFPKGLTHGFGPNMAIFPTFLFLGHIAQKKVLYDILERKSAFKGYKKKEFQKVEKFTLSKGLTNVFGPKMAMFSTFFSRQYRAKKCLLRYSKVEKRLSRL